MFKSQPLAVVIGPSQFKLLLSLLLISISYQSQAYVYNEDPNALIASSRGGSALWDYCYGKLDETPLPADPRSLVVAGVNEGKAVHFNVEWRNCHKDPDAVLEAGPPKSCGELMQRFELGGHILDTGGPNVSALFTGDNYKSLSAVGGISVFSARSYNKLWTRWKGFAERPENFDELVSERYGSGFAGGRNPYPLPGEDPNETNGGSGNLPEMFTQVREPDGSWSGKIGVTCFSCHSGQVGRAVDGPGLGVLYGGGNSTADLNLFLRDMLPLGYTASLVTPLNLTQTRGTNNASAVNIAFVFPDKGLPAFNDIMSIAFSGSTGGIDTPAFWNMGHRPAKFMDGLFAMDATSVDAVFYSPFLGLFGGFFGDLSEDGKQWMRDHGGNMNIWVESQKAPVYPFYVNRALAEEGAVLFHELDLWAEERNNPIDRPEGNGSCAGCHGAYAPRYVNNRDYLDTPELEGMAGYIVPLDIVGTDTARVLTNNEGMQKAGSKNFFGYPATKGTNDDCGPQNQKRLRGNREIGYLAPPLYGTWASAPYLHNGSVPNLWELLKPEERNPIWRRVSTPRPSTVPEETVMGFDTDIHRAFDQEKLGWKYDVLSCNQRYQPSVMPGLNCSSNDPEATPFFQRTLNYISSNIVAAWNILYPPIVNTSAIENRKIYNTHLYGQGNEGHEFNSVLTDAERWAIIEYLKTL